MCVCVCVCGWVGVISVLVSVCVCISVCVRGKQLKEWIINLGLSLLLTVQCCAYVAVEHSQGLPVMNALAYSP